MKAIIILLRFIVAFLLLFSMMPACAPFRSTGATVELRYEFINNAYPHLDLYEHPMNETEIVAIDWKNMLVFIIKMGGRAPYTFILLDKARNSDYILNRKPYEDKTGSNNP